MQRALWTGVAVMDVVGVGLMASSRVSISLATTLNVDQSSLSHCLVPYLQTNRHPQSCDVIDMY